MNKIKYGSSTPQSELYVVSVSYDSSNEQIQNVELIIPYGTATPLFSGGSTISYPSLSDITTILSGLSSFIYGYYKNNIWVTYGEYQGFSKISSTTIKQNQIINNYRVNIAVFTMARNTLFNLSTNYNLLTNLPTINGQTLSGTVTNSSLRICKSNTSSTWSDMQYTPSVGEICYYTDTNKIKIGDGTTSISALSFVSAGNNIPKSDLAQSVQNSLNLADTAIQQSYLTSNYRTITAQNTIDNTKASISDLNSHINNSNIHVTTSDKSSWNGKYTKPSDGIPATDLAQAVQTSLSKANSAIQSLTGYATQMWVGQQGFLTSHQDISGKENLSNKVTSLTSASTNTQYPSAKAVYDKCVCLSEHVHGYNLTISGTNAFAVNECNEASGAASFATGSYTEASGNFSHSEGKSTIASGEYSHAEGAGTTASGTYSSHAEGTGTTASGWYGSHAEGESTIASGYASHAEGYDCTASGMYSHAEGESTIASGDNSHAEGEDTQASSSSSHAEGRGTIAKGFCQHVSGKYNSADYAGVDGVYAVIVGNGTSNSVRRNAYTLDWSGNGLYSGKLTVGSAPTQSMDVATKGYVDGLIANLQSAINALS